ncbi:hypothetical protein [uncultured Brachyspira sp.]|uniref:hypothetical protein n=1 Tax=uncultured Brachyspira sp. TaxID=221953 RepID=UPI0025D0F0FE|nr:hypothetical protein [uncultured Brachyspira sp.]
MKKSFILLIIMFTALVSCSKKIDKNTVVRAVSKISSVNIIIGNTIDYEVRIISKNDIEYNFEDLSFDDRENKSRIISVENQNRNIGNYKERIIKYKIGFYDVGQFVVYPFKISYNYKNEYYELNGEDTAVLVHPFSDGETLPPMKNTISIEMPKYVWIFTALIVFAIIGVIVLIFVIAKYIENKFNEKINIKEDTEALNKLKGIDINAYYNENKYAQYYFELTSIFKRYLTKRFRFNIEDMTTSEINQLFKENIFNESEYIINMLKEADYVKFAKQIPELNIMHKDYDFCVNYIINNGSLSAALKLEEKEKKKIRKLENKKLKKLKKNKLKKENEKQYIQENAEDDKQELKI